MEQRIEGYTVVIFTVTPEGGTKDVRAIESNHKIFERTSINAAAKYRYKPKIINGEAVEVKNVRMRLEYRLGY
ncbi:MAG: TonB family protein [Emcibacteraceae bacterium]|nr:TonB family protein [Emcibacteraceae bacterium]